MKLGAWLVLGAIGALVIYGANQPRSAVGTVASPAAPPQSTPVTNSQPIVAAPLGSGLTFHGYDCTDDCSGHRAGYDWAEEHGISDPDDCGGNSESFIEGCKAFAGEEGPNDDDEDSDKDSE